MKKVYKISINMPIGGYVQPESMDNFLLFAQKIGSMDKGWEFMKREPRYEFYWFSTGRILTAFAREKLIDTAIKINADYALMFDDDMLLPGDYMEKMIENIEKHPEIDIIAPLAFMRNPPHAPVIYTVTEGFDSSVGQPYYINKVVRNYPKDQLVECDAVGFGSVLINMRIIKKMKPPYFFSTTGSGEDIYFCTKARKEADARIFVDTRIKLGHLGNPVIIDEEYVEKYNKENKVEIEDKPYKYLNNSR